MLTWPEVGVEPTLLRAADFLRSAFAALLEGSIGSWSGARFTYFELSARRLLLHLPRFREGLVGVARARMLRLHRLCGLHSWISRESIVCLSPLRLHSHSGLRAFNQ